MLKSVAACSSILICCVHLNAQYEEVQAVVIPDTTVPFDTAWYNHLWDSVPHSQIRPVSEVTEGDSTSANEPFIYPWFGDSTMVLTTTYTVIVNEPNPCVDPSLLPSVPELTPLTIAFTEARTYPWYLSSSWELSSYTTMYFPPPLQNTHNIDLLDQDTTHTASTISSFSETNARQISSSPPPAIPEPPKPVSVPEQPWYQAVLPNPIRVRKS